MYNPLSLQAAQGELSQKMKKKNILLVFTLNEQFYITVLEKEE